MLCKISSSKEYDRVFKTGQGKIGYESERKAEDAGYQNLSGKSYGHKLEMVM